jgi:hypothetical protein
LQLKRPPATGGLNVFRLVGEGYCDTAAPHLLQNFTPKASGVPQEEQVAAANWAAGGFTAVKPAPDPVPGMV